jgi:signal transduction histidine kinase
MRKEIIIAAGRLRNIVNDMLDALEIERGIEFEFKPVDILDIIEEVAKTLKPNYDKKGLYLDIRSSGRRTFQ